MAHSPKENASDASLPGLQGVGAANTSSSASHLPEPVKSGSLLILLIDDDEDLRLLGRKILNGAGHRVLEAATGIEGLELVASRSPDLLVVDLFMPGIDGFEVLRRVRSEETGRSLPVIVLSASGDEVSLHRSFELGATDFLAKPFSPPQLIARVNSCFARAPHQREGMRGESSDESI